MLCKTVPILGVYMVSFLKLGLGGHENNEVLGTITSKVYEH